MSILPHNVGAIPNPFLVVCEGYGDLRLIDALLNSNHIANCDVGCPSDRGGTGSGKSGIAKYLLSVKAVIEKGTANLQGIAVVADANGNAATSFDAMVLALQDAYFESPPTPFTFSAGMPRTGVFLNPGQGMTGCLENLLWDAAVRQNPALDQCVTDFFLCTGNQIALAQPNHQAKMRMSAIVAAHCKDNPWASSGLMWSDPGNPVPITSPRFNDLVDFLQQFVA